MKLHANARTCPNSRKLLVTRIDEEGWSLMVAVAAKKKDFDRAVAAASERLKRHG